MKATWKRIESWLSTNAPEILEDLLPGATAEEVRSAEKLLSIKYPSSVKTSYSIHNGQQGDSAPLMGEWQLLSLEDMIGQWKIMQDLLESGKIASVTSTPIGPIKPDWWNAKWVPLAYNGAGDFNCLDLDPAPGGDIGQIITFWHMEDKRERLAKSFQAWLQDFADDLQESNYRVKNGHLVLNKKEGP